VLISVAAADYSSVIGAAMTSTQAQTIQNAFGVNWSGADDLVTYLKNNPALFPPTRVFGGLSSEGCLIDNLRIKLDTNEPCGMYFLDSAGAHAPGAYPASFQGARFTLSTANPGGGVLVSNSGVLLKIVSTGTKWAIGNNIVAQGGGNIVAQGGGNIVAQGGGNIVAQGGGNIVAQGGGNIVAQGGGNLINDGAQYLKALTFVDASTAASAAHLITPGGASIISQDGNGFLPNMSQVAAVAKLIGQNSLGIASAGGAGVISAKPGASLGDNAGGIALSSAAQSASTNSAIATQSASRVIGENSSGIVGFNGSGVTANNPLLTDNGAAAVYSAQSVSAGQAAVITGPSAWTAGQSAMITWSPIPNTAACASGYRVLLNGNIQTGNATALSVGKSLVQPTTFTKGTKVSISLVSLCNGNPVAIPYTSIIQ
jgi:hypothetical protein